MPLNQRYKCVLVLVFMFSLGLRPFLFEKSSVLVVQKILPKQNILIWNISDELHRGTGTIFIKQVFKSISKK